MADDTFFIINYLKIVTTIRKQNDIKILVKLNYIPIFWSGDHHHHTHHHHQDVYLHEPQTAMLSTSNTVKISLALFKKMHTSRRPKKYQCLRMPATGLTEQLDALSHLISSENILILPSNLLQGPQIIHLLQIILDIFWILCLFPTISITRYAYLVNLCF